MKNAITKTVKLTSVIILCLLINVGYANQSIKILKAKEILRLSETKETMEIMIDQMFDSSKKLFDTELQKEINVLSKDIREMQVTRDYIDANNKMIQDFIKSMKILSNKFDFTKELEVVYANDMTDDELDAIIKYLKSSAAKKEININKNVVPKLMVEAQSKIIDKSVAYQQKLQEDKMKLAKDFYAEIKNLG